ncbi:MAG TPA: hypothetical protein VGR61_09180 [Candidatus Dormibacteraeota bacterium]|nr:hypothetical protein [Candidatus Dormibacteraeota bacterium]
MARPHTVDLETVQQILAEARAQESEVISEEVPPDSAIKKLGAVKLQELDGSTVALGTLWESRPAALVFLRHYG